MPRGCAGGTRARIKWRRFPVPAARPTPQQASKHPPGTKPSTENPTQKTNRGRLARAKDGDGARGRHAGLSFFLGECCWGRASQSNQALSRGGRGTHGAS